jgi:class 3 adenylate cyclase
VDEEVGLEIARLSDELRMAEDRERAVSNLMQTLANSAFDLDAVLQSIADIAAELCHAHHANIARRDGDGYRVVKVKGQSAEYERMARERVYKPERISIIGRALLERRVVQIEDVLRDPDYGMQDMQRVGDFRCLAAAPMLRDGEVLGVLAIGRPEPRAFTESELRLLQTLANQAVVAIETVRLYQTVEHQRAELASFAPEVASLLSSESGEALLAGHRREITALFCDLRGFTHFTETAEPEEVMAMLRQYHDAVGGLIISNGGTVEQFAGDGILVFFNDPAPVPDHQMAAVRTAIGMRDRLTELALGWRKRGFELGLGIGVASGYATLGRVGFAGRYAYAAIGPTINLASRLSDVAQAGEILLAPRTFAVVEDLVTSGDERELSLKGFSRVVTAHPVLDLRSPTVPQS